MAKSKVSAGKVASKGKSKPTEDLNEKGRKVVYPELTIRPLSGDNRLYAEQAKELLGWTPLGQEEKGHYTLLDAMGNRVRCVNNDRNRPFDESHARKLAQDILNGHWKLNGESIIVGKTGLILSGQHRLAALVYAWQLWGSTAQGNHWSSKWEQEPSIETLLVCGIDESPEVTRTLDNVKPRILS